MHILIYLTSRRAEISLKNGEVVVAQRSFDVNGDLSGKILLEIDAALSDAGVRAADVEYAECVCDGAGATTERIGEIAAKSYNFFLRSEATGEK